MTPFLLRISISITLLHTALAFSTADLHDIVKAIRRAIGQYTNSSLEVAPPNTLSASLEERYLNDKKPYRNATVLDDHSKIYFDIPLSGNDVFGILPNNDARSKYGLRARHTTTTVIKGKKIATQKYQREAKEARQRDHEQRVKEIAEHMEHHYLSTEYFYYEAKRIQKTNVVMDDTRQMILDAENPKYIGLRQIVLECGRVLTTPKPTPVWKKTNNLVINVLKDSINDGVLI